MMTETYVVSGSKATILKDPNAVLDYTWDWGDYLADVGGDVIDSYDVLVEAPLVIESKQRVGHQIIAFISGGTVDSILAATCRITTTGGRTDDRSIYLKIVER